MIRRLLTVFLLPVLILSIGACSLQDFATPGGTEPQPVVEQTAATSEAAASEAPSALQSETAQAAGGKAVKMALYFPTEDNSALKKEERELQVFNGAIIKATVEALMKGPETSGLHSGIPAGTVLNGVNIKDRVAIVDFSKEFAAAKGTAGTVGRISVVNTLTGIAGVEKVTIRIDGKELAGPDGKPLGSMAPAKLDKNGAPLPD